MGAVKEKYEHLEKKHKMQGSRRKKPRKCFLGELETASWARTGNTGYQQMTQQCNGC